MSTTTVWVVIITASHSKGLAISEISGFKSKKAAKKAAKKIRKENKKTLNIETTVIEK